MSGSDPHFTDLVGARTTVAVELANHDPGVLLVNVCGSFVDSLAKK